MKHEEGRMRKRREKEEGRGNKEEERRKMDKGTRKKE